MWRLSIIFCVVLFYGCSTIPYPAYPSLNFKHKLRIKPQVALVLGGGGARGFAHLGVLKALEEAKIPINLIVGTSAGSIVGSLYAANPNIYSVTDIMMKSTYGDYVDFSLRLAFSGPVIGAKLQKFIRKNTANCDFCHLKIPFIAIATDLNSGQTIPVSNGSLPLAVEASAAVPSVVRPIRFENLTLVDGGVSDPVPVDIAKSYHPKVIIAVNIGPELPHHFALVTPSILRQSLDIMMMSLTKYNVKDADVVIRPKVGSVGIFDLSKKLNLYYEGYVAGKKAVPQIKKLLRQ